MSNTSVASAGAIAGYLAKPVQPSPVQQIPGALNTILLQDLSTGASLSSATQFAPNKSNSAFKEYIRPSSVALDLSMSTDLDQKSVAGPEMVSVRVNSHSEAGPSCGGDYSREIAIKTDKNDDTRSSPQQRSPQQEQQQQQQEQQLHPMLQHAQLQLQQQLLQGHQLQHQTQGHLATTQQALQMQGQSIGLNPMMPSLNMLVSASQQFADMNAMDNEGDGDEEADTSDSEEDTNPEDALEIYIGANNDKGCQVCFASSKSRFSRKNNKRKATSSVQLEESENGGNGKNKKPRLIWTPELHARFLNAVNHLGVKNAVPKTILQLMNVEGMTRENVASHLQKYRLYLKRLAGLPPNAPLSSETLQQVQTVQQAMQHQLTTGLAGFPGGVASVASAVAAGPVGAPMHTAAITAVSAPMQMPLQALSLNNALHGVNLQGAANYQDLLSQLSVMNGGAHASVVGSAPAAGPASVAALGAAAAASHMASANGAVGAHSAAALSALHRSNPLISVITTPGIVPIGICPMPMGGFGGINPSMLGQTISLISPLGGNVNGLTAVLNSQTAGLLQGHHHHHHHQGQTASANAQ